MFLDASAIVTMLADEEERPTLLATLASATDPITSPLATFETALAIARRKGLEPVAALEAVEEFLSASGVRVVEIGLAEQRIALLAHTRFGKGRHPAALNMGDCFAYACALANGQPLFFKGNDFSQTDIERA
ncbi:MAG: type II toxin-antitoxin system VapC family toxin [Caulobacter sp.]|nr:type II toxin-antitoxin system VapC family toxin [Caulobacter sp.]